MTPYTFNILGSYTITYPDGTIERFNVSPAMSRSLTCSALVRGNHVLPNNWSFQTDRNGGIQGQIKSPYSGPHGNGFSTWSGQFLLSDSSTQGVFTWDAGDAALAQAKALDGLYESIRGGTDLSVDGFQMRQTLSLNKDIYAVLQKVGQFVVGVKSGLKPLSRALVKKINKRRAKRGQPPITRKRDWRDPVQALASARLIDVYGLQPTLQSIHDAISHTRTHYLEVGKEYQGKGAITRTEEIRKSNVIGGLYDVKMTCSTSFRTFYKVYMCIPDNDLTSAARLSSLNPASIAWELMPFSFVVDWFIDIGGYVRSLESALIYQNYFKNGSRSDSNLYTLEAYFTRHPAQGTGWLTESRRHTGNTRTVLATMPFPKPPIFKADLGSSRLLNAAALLTNLLGRK